MLFCQAEFSSEAKEILQKEMQRLKVEAKRQRGCWHLELSPVSKTYPRERDNG
jgi:hypothetical protein